MPDALFQYPGGKGRHAERILNNMPTHDCYVEAMCGSADLLLNKPRSEVEIINDLDSDIMTFFGVYQHAPEELKEYVKDIPYSRKTYLSLVTDFYSDNPPGESFDEYPVTGEDVTSDHVIRAGVFYFLRYTQWGAKYSGKSGFGASKVQDQAGTWTNAIENLTDFIDRLQDVTIECKPYHEVSEIYDGEDTFHYFDPPYIGTEQYYRESDFDHQEFVKFLHELDGYWMVSYDSLPHGLDEFYVSVEDATAFIDSGYKGEGSDMEEYLVTNYEPSAVPAFVTGTQTSFGSLETEQQTADTGAVADGGGETFSFDDLQEEDENGDGFLSEYDV